MPWATVGP